MNWIDLAQYREKWRALVNAVMNLCVPKKTRGISWLAENFLASQERLLSFELVIWSVSYKIVIHLLCFKVLNSITCDVSDVVLVSSYIPEELVALAIV
jgi:hypothetical protein